MSRVFIIHGWGGNPDEAWIPWLKRELEAREFIVIAPKMPDTDNPRIQPWIGELARLVINPDEQTFFIGHSIGCQAIMRYLETVDGKVGGVICVAGWFNLIPECMPTPEERAIGKPWLETPIDTERVKQAAGHIVAIFSDNDDAVPLSDADLFRNRLGATIIIERGRGHFSGGDGITELPTILTELVRIAKAE